MICFTYIFDSNKRTTTDKNELKPSEMRGFFVMTLFNTLFMLFILQILSQNSIPSYFIPCMILGSLFVGVILREVSLLILSSAFNKVNILFKKDFRAKINIPKRFRQKLNELKIYYFTNWIFIMILLFVLFTVPLNSPFFINYIEEGINFMNSVGGPMNLKIWTKFSDFLLPISILLVSLRVIGIGIYEVILSSTFYKIMPSDVLVTK
jgi:hypothetical protein